MRRVDDFVKLLVGLVVGQFLRDVHAIRDGLVAFMGHAGSVSTSAQVLAEVFPYVFAAFVIRNVHASFRYDLWCSARPFQPKYEKRVRGRALSFFGSLFALFVSAYAVEHYLATHFSAGTSNASGSPPVPVQELARQVAWLCWWLILPFLVYAAWDTALWVATDGPEQSKNRPMQRFVRRWLVVDYLGLAWLIGCYIYSSLVGTDGDGDLRRTVIAFTVLASGHIVADYVRNAKFYFAEVPGLDPAVK